MSPSQSRSPRRPRTRTGGDQASFVDKVTLEVPVAGSEVSGASESVCPEEPCVPSLHGDGGVAHPRELRVMPTVGRASTHTRRPAGRVVAEQVSPEEQVDRSRRTKRANDRRAFRRAADLAMDGVCTLHVVGVLDEGDDGERAVQEAQEFGHRVSDAHDAVMGSRCRYVGVVIPHDHVFEVHMLLSADVSVDVVLECWEEGEPPDVGVIEPGQIEECVFTMGEMSARSRLGSHRFIRSRGSKPPVEVFEVADIEEAREVLRELIAPQEPVLLSAQPFGRNLRASFRFRPIMTGSDPYGPGGAGFHQRLCEGS